MLIVPSRTTGFERSDETDYLMTKITIMIMKTTIIDKMEGSPVLDCSGCEVQMEATSARCERCALPLLAMKLAIRRFCSKL